MLMNRASSSCMRIGTCLRFKTTSVTSSPTPWDRSELVEYPFDLDGRDGRALDRREQDNAAWRYRSSYRNRARKGCALNFP